MSIPYPITSLRMEQELELERYRRDIESSSDIESLKRATIALIRENFVLRSNVAQLTKHCLQNEL